MVNKRLYDTFKEVIDRDGWIVLGVFPTEGAPIEHPFMYTIGNHLAGLPELLVLGHASDSVHEFMNAVTEKMRENKRPFLEEEVVDLGAELHSKVINANDQAKEIYTPRAGWFLGTEDYAVQQVLVPDPNGTFPDDPGCLPPFCWVPILKTKQ